MLLQLGVVRLSQRQPVRDGLLVLLVAGLRVQEVACSLVTGLWLYMYFNMFVFVELQNILLRILALSPFSNFLPY